MAFNRNIVTEKDAANCDRAQEGAQAMPKTFQVDPPTRRDGKTQSDDFLTQLVKFIPVEILGFYTLVASIVSANTDGDEARGWWLLGLFAGSVALAPLYMWRIAKVVRPAQNVAGAVAMAVYVFTVGGWFSTLSWYQPWYGAVAVAMAVIMLALFDLKPLPLHSADSGTKGGGAALGVVKDRAADDEAAQSPLLPARRRIERGLY